MAEKKEMSGIGINPEDLSSSNFYDPDSDNSIIVESKEEGRLSSLFRKHGIVLFTLIGAALGIATGLAFMFGGVNNATLLKWIGLPGVLFMRALTCMIVPLVFSSLVTSVANAGSTGGFRRVWATRLLHRHLL
jgi:hypothetical protein